MFSDAIWNALLTLLSLFGSHMAERSINRTSMLEDKLEETIVEVRALRREMEEQRYYKRKNDEA